MPPRSNVELQNLVDIAYHMWNDEKKTLAQVAKDLRAEGYVVSRSGIARAMRNRKQSMREYEAALQETEAIVKATEGTPGTQVGKAAMDVAMTKLFKEIKNIEDFRDMTSSEVISCTAQIARATATLGRLSLDYEKGYKEGLFAAAKKAGEEVKTRGLSEDAVEDIKAKILGLNNAAR